MNRLFTPWLRRMKTTVFTCGEHFEVFDTVISLVAITVMDVLIRNQRAAKVLFHHPAMLSNPLSRAESQADVAIPPQQTFTAVLRARTGTATKTSIAFANQNLWRRKCLPALFTGSFDGSTLPIVETITTQMFGAIHRVTRMTTELLGGLADDWLTTLGTSARGRGRIISHRRLLLLCHAGGVRSAARFSYSYANFTTSGRVNAELIEATP